MQSSDRQLLEERIARLARELAAANAELEAQAAVAVESPAPAAEPPPARGEDAETPVLLAFDDFNDAPTHNAVQPLTAAALDHVAPVEVRAEEQVAPVEGRAEAKVETTIAAQAPSAPALEIAQAAPVRALSIEEMFAAEEARLRPQDASPPAVWYKRPANIGIMAATFVALVLSVKVALRDDPKAVKPIGEPQQAMMAPAAQLQAPAAPTEIQVQSAAPVALQTRVAPARPGSRGRRR